VVDACRTKKPTWESLERILLSPPFKKKEGVHKGRAMHHQRPKTGEDGAKGVEDKNLGRGSRKRCVSLKVVK